MAHVYNTEERYDHESNRLHFNY